MTDATQTTRKPPGTISAELWRGPSAISKREEWAVVEWQRSGPVLHLPLSTARYSSKVVADRVAQFEANMREPQSCLFGPLDGSKAIPARGIAEQS